MLLLRTRVFVGVVAAVLVLMAVGMFFVLDPVGRGAGAPPVWAVGALVVVVAWVVLVVVAVGHRTRAIPAGTPPDRAREVASKGFGAVVARRAVLAELIGFVAVGLGAVAGDDGGYVVLVAGVVAAEAVLVGLAWPRERTVRLVAVQLERDGVPSGLLEVVGARTT